MSLDQQFAEQFTSCMADAQIRLDETGIADAGYFSDAVRYVKSWFDGLDDRTQAAFDAAAQTGEPVAVHLVNNNVAPGLADLMADFDNNAGWPVSTLLDWCLHCLEIADQSQA